MDYSALADRALESDDGDVEVLAEIQMALRHLEQPPVTAADSYWIGRFLYDFHGRLGRRDDSQRHFRRAVDGDPDDWDARFMLGCSCFDAREYRAAVDVLAPIVENAVFRSLLNGTWRWLKALELTVVARAELGCGDFLAEAEAWHTMFDSADEEDRPYPREVRAYMDAHEIPSSLFPRVENPWDCSSLASHQPRTE